MIVLGVDFETTVAEKVDPLELRIIEVGAVVWDTDRKAPLKMSSHLVWGPGYPEFSPKITEITGIAKHELDTYAVFPQTVLRGLSDLMKGVDCIVAHNGNGFDKPLLEQEGKRAGIPMPEKHWVDTMVDVPYPEKIKVRGLEFLAAAHGFLNPFPHRALFDVMTMLKVMSQYNFEEVLKRSKTPRVTLQAYTDKPWEDGGASNTKAKELGFRFDGDKKIWTKTVFQDEADEMIRSASPLRVVLLA